MSKDLSRDIYESASKEIGTWEFKGAENNPVVLEYYSDAGHPKVKQDSVPWCAAFVGAILARMDLPTTNSLLARSYLDWGTEVHLTDAAEGDVVVIKRGKSTWQGHVGFYAGATKQSVKILGGNQGDQVNIKSYAKSKLLGIRRVHAPNVKPKKFNLLDSILSLFGKGK